MHPHTCTIYFTNWILHVMERRLTFQVSSFNLTLYSCHGKKDNLLGCNFWLKRLIALEVRQMQSIIFIPFTNPFFLGEIKEGSMIFILSVNILVMILYMKSSKVNWYVLVYSFNLFTFNNNDNGI